MKYDSAFWHALEKLVSNSEIVIDRPKGAAHPRYPDLLYPLDYGYLQDTTSMDSGGIDVWKGSDVSQTVNGIICTVDLAKRDSEIKLLIGCTRREIGLVYTFHNKSACMKGILIKRKV